jgi:hypothetical protein
LSVLKRYNRYQGLRDLDVLIQDDAPISQYFNIVEVPDIITQGRSSFLVGGSELLKDNVELKFEIINDASGKVVYTEPVANYLEGTSRRVSIEVYDDPDTFGDATLYAVGELNPNEVEVPPEWLDIYNVRWYTKIYISGAGVNIQPIYFYKQPSMWVGEIIKGFVQTTYPTGSVTQSTGTVTGDPLPGTEGTTPAAEVPGKEIELVQKGYKSKVFGGGGKNAGVSSRGRNVRRASPELDNFTINLYGDTAEAVHIGATFRVNSPKAASSFVTESYHEFPEKFETTVKDVKNDSTLIPSKEFTIYDTRYPVDDERYEVVVPLEESAYTMSFQPIPTHSVSSVNFRSFADVRISKLRTFSGDIHRVKLYSKNKDAFGDFELIADTPIESPELLFDVFGSAGSRRIGYLDTQTTINTYWASGSNTLATHNSTYSLDSVYLSGSNIDENSILKFESTGSLPIEFYKDIEYSVRAKVIGRTGTKTRQGITTVTGELGIFLSGSSFESNHSLGEEFGYQITPPGSSQPGLLEIEDGTLVDFGIVEEVFTPLNDGTAVLQFGAPAGSWYISDISIRPVSDTGFSPDWIRIVASVPPLSQERPDDYEFLAEFYDINNNVADTISHVSASTFQGANTIILGDDNLFSGSIFIGNALYSGIEMAGVGSAYVRSMGYLGFSSASNAQGTNSGFMMWSGSVLPDSGDDYKGVGLELVGTDTSYFKFRTNPSELDIRADSFFVGNPDSQFISGSGDNIEISSSNFHVQPDGDVLLSGTITAEAGNIGDWQIIDGKLSGSNATLDAVGAALYKTDASPESNPLDGYYIDFTPGSNYYIRMGSDFAVSSSGQLFASGAKIEGVLTASEGYIAGWTIASDTIHKYTNPDYTGLASTGNTRFFGGATDLNSLDTAVFNVKSDGQVTGSDVLFTGGKIAGWTIDGNVFKSPAGTGGIRLHAGNKKITITSHTFGNSGIQLDDNSGSPRFYVGDGSNDYIKYEHGTGVDIKTIIFDLTTPTMVVDSGVNSGKISLGATPNTSVAGTNTGFYVDGTGDFLVRGDANNYMKMYGSGLQIKSQDFALSGSTTLILDTTKLAFDDGTAGNATAASRTAGRGVFMNTSGEFRAGTAGGNRITFDGSSALEIVTTDLNIDTSTFDVSTDNGGTLSLGTLSSLNTNTTDYGVYMSGSGETLIKGSATANDDYILFNSSGVQIRTQDVDITTTGTNKIKIDSTGTPVIAMGATLNTNVSGTNKGVYIDGTGNFLLYGSSTNYFKFDASGASIDIKSDTFDLATPQMTMSSATYNGKIALGATPPTAYNSGDGFYVDGFGRFLIGSGSGDHVQFDGTNFDVEVGNFELKANDIQISSTRASMSLGGVPGSPANIVLDGLNDTIYVGAASGKRVTLVGSSTQGYIATGKSSVTDSTAGFWLANNNTDPEFNVGDSTDFIRFNGGNLDINSQRLEVAASTLQMSTTQASMSLGHSVTYPQGRIILEGLGTPTFAVGPDADFISMTTGSGIYMDGDGNFKFGDDDGQVSFYNGSFSITGSDVSIQVTDVNIRANGFQLSSNQASMSLGTNYQWKAYGGSANPYLSIGQGGNGVYEDTGLFLGYNDSLSRPRVSFVGSTGHFKFSGTDLDIKTGTLEVDATNIELSSTQASASFGEGKVVILGGSGRINVGTTDASGSVSIQGGGTDNFIVMGSKNDGSATSFPNFDQSTVGVVLGVDSGTPKFEMVGSTSNYFSYDGSNLDIKLSQGFELDATNIELSSQHASASFGEGKVKILGGSGRINVGTTDVTGSVSIQGGGVDNFIVMGAKNDGSSTSFTSDTSTAGIIFGVDSGTPKFEIAKNSSDYFKFDTTDGLDIKTTAIEVAASNVQISSLQASMSIGDPGSTGGAVVLQADGSDKMLRFGSKTTFDQDTTDGFIMGINASDNKPELDFTIGTSDNQYVRFTSDGIFMRVPNFELDTATFDISSANKRLSVFKSAASGSEEVVRLGEISEAAGDLYGIKIYDGTQGTYSDDGHPNTLVMFGEQGNKIGGWEITNGQIRSIPNAGFGGQFAEGETGLILQASGSIETSDFVTGLKGWRISALGNGSAEFENARIRGTLRTTVFEKESVNVVGGQLMIANSTTLEALKDVSGSIIAGVASMSAADVTMSVANVSGFRAGEILKSKRVDDTGFSVEYMYVTGSMRYTHPSSSVSESIKAADMGAIDPDGLAGELYLGRGYGQNNVISSSVGTLDGGIDDTETDIILSTGTGYAIQSILKVDEERMKVVSHSTGGGLVVVRDFHDTTAVVHSDGTTVYVVDPDAEFLSGLVSTAQPYNEGQVIVSTGVYAPDEDISSGYIMMNANPNDISTPYMDIVERTGSGVYDLQLRTRLGDLSGLSSAYLYGNEEPGFGLYTENGFFKGALHAMTGSIHGILHIATIQGGIETNQKISIGRNVNGSQDGIYINNNNYWFTDAEWRVGDGTNYLHLTGSGGNLGNDLRIKLEKFELNAGSGDLKISSTEKSMSFGNGDIEFQSIDATQARAHIGSSTSNRIYISGSSTEGYIYSGKPTYDSSTAGFWLGQSGNVPKFHVGDGTDFINYSGETIDMAARAFTLNAGGGDLHINSVGKYISIADGHVYLDGSGNVGYGRFGSNASTQHNIIISGSATQAIIKAGISGSYGDIGDQTGWLLEKQETNAYFFVGTTGDYIKFDGSNIRMVAEIFRLNAGSGDLTINSAAKTISIADGNILLDGSGNVGFAKFGSNTATQHNIIISGSTTQAIVKAGISGSYADIGDQTGWLLERQETNTYFHIGSPTEYIKFDGSNIDISADSLVITASNVNITAGDGMEVDAPHFDSSTANISMSLGYDTNSGRGINLYGGASANYIKFGSKASPPLQLFSGDPGDASTDNYLSVGGKTWGGTDTGVIIGSDAGVYKLEMYKDEDEYFKFATDATGLDVRAHKIRLATPGMFIQGTEASAGSNRISLGGSSGSMSSTSGLGFWADGGGTFRIGTGTSGTSFMYFNSGNEELKIKTTNLTIDTDNLDIVASGSSAYIRGDEGGHGGTFSERGFILSSSGYFNFQDNSGNYIRNDGTMALKSSNLQLTGSDTFLLHGNTGGAKIRMGATAANITETTTTGVYMDSSGKFRVGEGTSGDNYIHFGGSSIDMKSTSFNLNADSGKLILESSTPRLVLSTTSAYVKTGDVSSLTDTGESGIWLQGDGQFLIASGSTDYIQNIGSGLKIVSSDMDITATEFSLTGGSTIYITEGDGGKIALGSSATGMGLTSTGVFLSGSGEFNFQEDASNYIRQDGSGLQIVANDGFHLSSTSGNNDLLLTTTKFLLDDSATASGSVTRGTGTGVYMDNTGAFRAGVGGGNSIDFDGSTTLTIQSTVFSLDATSIYMDSAAAGGAGMIGLGIDGSAVTHGAVGSYLDGAGKFSFVESTTNFIKGGDSNFEIQADTFGLGTATMVISSSVNNGTIRLGTNGGPLSETVATKGTYIDGDGNFQTYTSATNYFRKTDSGIDIQADTFGLGTATMVVSSSVNSGTIRLGTNGGPISETAAVQGIYMDGTGAFQVYGDTSNYIRFDGGTVDIRTDEILILTGGSNKLKLFADGSATPSISMGTSLPASATSGTGFYADGAGNLLVGSSTGNHLQYLAAGTIDIKSTVFNLDATSIIIDSSASDGKIALGASPNSSGSGTNQGIYMDGTGDFLAYAGPLDYIRKGQNKLDIVATDLNLVAGGGQDLIIDSSLKRIMLASNNIILDGDSNSGAGHIEVGSLSGVHTNQTQRGIYLKGDGEVLIKAGSVVNEDYLLFDSDGLEIKTKNITFEKDGTITSQDYLIERSRLFGAGDDGEATGSGAISGTTTLSQDMYYNNLTVTGTLKTNGFRVYVKGTLTNSGTIECRGSTGTQGSNSYSGNAGKAGGAGGIGANSGTLGGGADGGIGGIGGTGGSGADGGAGGGGGGGSSGIMFIAARLIVNTGTISVKGGTGGQGGRSVP